jgi:hypothetical protein
MAGGKNHNNTDNQIYTFQHNLKEQGITLAHAKNPKNAFWVSML